MRKVRRFYRGVAQSWGSGDRADDDDELVAAKRFRSSRNVKHLQATMQSAPIELTHQVTVIIIIVSEACGKPTLTELINGEAWGLTMSS